MPRGHPVRESAQGQGGSSLAPPLLLGLLVYAGLAVLAHLFAEPLGRLMLGPIGWTAAQLFPQFDIVNLDVGWMRGEMVYVLEVHPARPFLVGTRVVADVMHPLATLTATTPVKHWLQTGLVAFTLAAAWPGASILRRGLAMLLVLPLLAPVALMDAPLVLAGALDDLLRAAFAPHTLGDSWLIAWMRVMEGGGRLAAGAAAAYAAVRLSTRFFTKL